MGEADAFRRAAELTPEPSTARTYQLLAAGVERGVDLGGGLLALSADIRDTRREQMHKDAVRRRAAMLVPTIAILAPIMLLFIAAPLPSIVSRSSLKENLRKRNCDEPFATNCRDEAGMTTAELLGNATLGVLALVVIWGLLQSARRRHRQLAAQCAHRPRPNRRVRVGRQPGRRQHRTLPHK